MRTLRFLALGAVLVFGLAAAQAHAVSTINLKYVGGSSVPGAAADCGAPIPKPPEQGVGDFVPCSIDSNPSDVLTFDVDVSIDSSGIGGIGFDLQWITADVNQTSLSWETGTVFTSFAPLMQATLLTPLPIAVGPINAPNSSRIRNIGFFSLTPPFNTSIFLGTVAFHVGSAPTTEIMTGLFATDGSSVGNGFGTFITPNFTSFTVSTPTPRGTLSLLAGLLTLALVTFRRR